MIGFDDLQGEAKKGAKVDYMKLSDGDNTFRIVGNILPGYSYWVKGANGKDLPFECLQFDRENEKFNPSLPDPVKDLGIKDANGEDLRCGWAYRCNVINKATGKLEVLTLKKGMLQDIISYAKRKKVNPTDPETGCWITVERQKTGPHAFNVKYIVDPYFESEPLTEKELGLVKEMKPLDEVFVRETYEEQKKRLQDHITPKQESSDGGSDAEQDAAAEAQNELD
tara:strand:+ start:161 stop:835 length:675 start_codon:yes stop_codon:yes gene_type:complete